MVMVGRYPGFMFAALNSMFFYKSVNPLINFEEHSSLINVLSPLTLLHVSLCFVSTSEV